MGAVDDIDGAGAGTIPVAIPSVLDALKAAATTTHVGTARALMPIIKDMILRDPLFLKDLRLALFEGKKPLRESHRRGGPTVDSRTPYEKVVLGLMLHHAHEQHTATTLLDRLHHMGLHRGKKPLDYLRLALTKLVRLGLIVRQNRGVYTVVDPPAPPPPEAPQGNPRYDFFRQLETRYDED